MNTQDRWVGEVVNQVCSFVPKRKWFSRPEDAKVWISAYRAYRISSDIVSQIRSFVADFEQVRAVLLRWDAPYQKLDQNVIEQTDGQITLERHPFHVYRTGYGVLLLLITPYPTTMMATTKILQGKR